MGHRSLRWVGRTKSDLLHSKLQTDLDHWTREWSANGSVLSIEKCVTALENSNNISWLCMELSNRSITVGFARGTFAKLAEQLVKATSSCASGLPERIGEKALHALCAQWLGEDIQRIKCQSIRPPKSQAIDYQFGNTALILTGSGLCIALLVPLDFVDHFFQRNPSNKVAITSTKDAIAQEQLGLKVVLDLGAASVSNAYNLKVGDVIVSNTPLNSNFHLQSLEGREIAEVKLHRNNSKRSIKIHSAAGTAC